MSLALTTPITGASSPSLDASTLADIEHMVRQWSSLLRGNRLKQQYYDQKDLFKDFRISTPPQLRDIEATVGWAAKPVDVLADRISFERFIAPDVETNPFGLTDVAAWNSWAAKFKQAVVSSLTHSCSFVSVAVGFDGETRARWHVRSAEQATGLWDHSRFGLRAALTVAVDDDGRPERFFAYFPDRSFEIVPKGGKFVVTAMSNPTGRVPVELFAFKPDLRRPFGRSRINRSVRYYADGAVRTLVRGEVGAEFYAAPQRYGTGIDDDFDMDRWTALVGRFMTVSRDEDGNLPQLGQFPQHSMQPHTDHLRMWANMLAGESSIPINELGFVSDNPNSDKALKTQRDPLFTIAKNTLDYYRPGLVGLGTTTVMLQDGLSEVPDELLRLDVQYGKIEEESASAAADAAVKIASVVPWVAESPVFMRKMGFTPQEVDLLLEDRRRMAGGSVLDRLLAGDRDPVTPAASVVSDADEG